jgi:ketol-acid reductoisomerase
MAKYVFGNTEEEVVTRQEFSLEMARHVLQGELVAVLGYGVQGPAQALNMRDNGIKVIVGQKQGSKSWDKALADGWVPGDTLFSLTEAAERATVIQYLISDAGQRLMWPEIKECLKVGDALFFSHGFSIVYRDQTGVIPPEYVDVLMVAPKGSGRRCGLTFWMAVG